MKLYSSPTSGGARISAPPASPVMGQVIGRLVLPGFAGIAALFLVVQHDAPLVAATIVAGAPLLAAIAACSNSWAGPVFHRPLWLQIAAAAVLATGELFLAGPGSGLWSHALGFLSMLLLLAAGIRLLYAGAAATLETLVDVAIVLVVATAAVLHWTPAGQLLAGGPINVLLTGLVFAGPAILALASVLLLAPAASSAPGISSGAAALSIGALALFAAKIGIAATPQVEAISTIGGWAALAFGTLHAQRNAGALTAAASTGVFRLRHLIGPGVGVFMAVTLVHGAAGYIMRAPTAISLALLSSLLALRMTELLKATRQHSEARRELAQKRALVEVSTALAGSTDLNETLELVTSWTCRLLNTKAAAIELLQEDGRALVMHAAVGLPDHVIGMQFPVDGSFTGWVVEKREPRATADPSTDPFISGDSRTVLGRSPTAAAPMRCREHVLGALSCIGQRPFTPDDLELLQALADQAAVAIENARLFEQVHMLSVTDPLTNLSNRRQLDRDLSREFAAARRGRQLVAVMFDLNGFKDYNDRHGHLAGDQALRAFADALATETRKMNLAVRYGGDEFLVLLADADLEGTAVFIQRIRDRFNESIAQQGIEGLGFAAGIAEYHPGMRDANELIDAADRALYQVKRANT